VCTGKNGLDTALLAEARPESLGNPGGYLKRWQCQLRHSGVVRVTEGNVAARSQGGFKCLLASAGEVLAAPL